MVAYSRLDLAAVEWQWHGLPPRSGAAGAWAEGDLVVHRAVAGEGAAPVVVCVAVRLRALRLEHPRVSARLARRRRRELPVAAVLVRPERQARTLAPHHHAAAGAVHRRRRRSRSHRQLGRAHAVDVRRARRALALPASGRFERRALLILSRAHHKQQEKANYVHQ
jgi:hypothetical protein